MEKLNLPAIASRIRTGKNGKQEIFDEIRKKFVRLTPEEWVRQHFLHMMVNQLGYPASLIVVEAALKYNNMLKRFDILAYRADGKPCLVVECKSPGVEITQAVFDQVAMYNMTLTVDFVAVTNGLSHYSCQIDHIKRTYTFLTDLPTYQSVNLKS
ncbi:MAG: type I restriction enzyme HsdR N-terminal domain-containing protein [Bacteroidetes bacterium]|nr:type I restriction enzyme HsdR N-terminal domain-containing protein [Bacteroidota bacterium]